MVERDINDELTMAQWNSQTVFDKKDVTGILSMLEQTRRDIRYRRFADAEAIVVDLLETCKTRLWPGSLSAHWPSVTMDYPNSILCPASKNEELVIPELNWLRPTMPKKVKSFLSKLKEVLWQS